VRTLSGVVAVLASLIFAQPLLAASERDHQECDHAELDGMIAACTRILEDTAEETDSRALALFKRGALRRLKGEDDNAIADFDEAILLQPHLATFAGLFRSRGLAYEHKGDYDRAIMDFDETIRLDPGDASVFVSRGNTYFAKRD